MAASPVNNYTILDIRTSSLVSPPPPPTSTTHINITGKKEGPTTVCPPSPPSSKDPSLQEDVFNDADLVETILTSLNQPKSKKTIPTYVLYDTLGLQLFDQITYLKEYYLTDCEADILEKEADQLADRVKNGTVIIELGAGSLRKTKLILQAMEKKQKQVTYYALDLDQYELEKSLSSLGGEFKYVQLAGLLGTYEQGIPWISQQYNTDDGNGLSNTPKMVLWLGSSIGNQTRRESAVFVRKLQTTCLQPGDFFVIGFDRRNDPSIVSKAYHDSEGVTEKFIMNGLNHINTILGQPLFQLDDFEYASNYQPIHGRHVAHYRAKRDLHLVYTKKNHKATTSIHHDEDDMNKKRKLLNDSNNTVRIFIEKNELIHVEHSYKYDDQDISHILNTAELHMVEKWRDSKNLYQLVLAECRPFHFERDRLNTIKTLFPTMDLENTDGSSYQDEILGCTTCDTNNLKNQQQLIMEQQQTKKSNMASESLINITGSKYWPSQVPTLYEWEQLWASWDLVTRQMIDHKTMLFEKPISLRHPFIFYLGHIPAFLDIQLTRHQTDHEVVAIDNDGDMDLTSCSNYTEPKYFTEIFERGIDPDVDDPSKCHAHSEVPDKEDAWPSIDTILKYQENVRIRLRKILLFWEAQSYILGSNWLTPSRQRDARVVWMCFEHETMHLETLLYMLLQSPNINHPSVAPPAWYLALNNNNNNQKYQQKNDQIQKIKSLVLSSAPMLEFPNENMMVEIGHDDYLDKDGKEDNEIKEFGWDNEHPKRMLPVSSFEIQSRPITNGEYFIFWNELDEKEKESLLPASWKLNTSSSILPQIKTSFGLCPLEIAIHWPVQISYLQAMGYIRSLKDDTLRIPTEEEWIYFRRHVESTIPMKDQDKSSTLINNDNRISSNNNSSSRDIPNVGFANWTPTSLNNDQIHTVGDVWEWTSTIWKQYDGYTISELYPGYSADFFDDKHHIVLGGSWATHPRLSERVTLKNWYQAAYPYVFCGFRLCRSL